ncbi:MAG: PCP reductase family protein [bacterium]
MKFLCVRCDEPMKFKKVDGPDPDGSLAVLYHCDHCGYEIAMLTNAFETQMVKSLGVKVGGRTVPSAPMENVRDSLNTAVSDTESPGGCPFPAMIPDTQHAAAIDWSPDAQTRLDRIPEMVRPMVKQALEEYAREEGKSVVTPDLIDIAKEILGSYYKR